MTSPVAVIGLVWDGHDLARPDLDLFFDLTEGLDTLPEVRGEDQLIPFRAGRLPSQRIPHRRPLVATGHVMGPAGATARSEFRAYVDDLHSWMDPTHGERILVATLEDGSVRWIECAARNILPGEGWASEYRALSLEWEAVSDPMWHGRWGVLTADGDTHLADSGWHADGSAELVIRPTSDPFDVAVDTLGNADVERVRVWITGQAQASPVGVSVVQTGVGFVYADFLWSPQTVTVDNAERTVVALDGTVESAGRTLMTLLPANRGGEYLRLPAGRSTLRVIGQPQEVRILLTPSFQ